jgi:hypothetical protein
LSKKKEDLEKRKGGLSKATAVFEKVSVQDEKELTMFVASMRDPTTRTRTSVPVVIFTDSSDEMNDGSGTPLNSYSSGIKWFDTKSCNGPASAKKPTCTSLATRLQKLKRAEHACYATHPHTASQAMQIWLLHQTQEPKYLHLVDACHNCIHDLAFERAENNAVVVDSESCRAHSRPDPALSDPKYMRHADQIAILPTAGPFHLHSTYPVSTTKRCP